MLTSGPLGPQTTLTTHRYIFVSIVELLGRVKARRTCSALLGKTAGTMHLSFWTAYSPTLLSFALSSGLQKAEGLSVQRVRCRVPNMTGDVA